MVKRYAVHMFFLFGALNLVCVARIIVDNTYLVAPLELRSNSHVVRSILSQLICVVRGTHLSVVMMTIAFAWCME